MLRRRFRDRRHRAGQFRHSQPGEQSAGRRARSAGARRIYRSLSIARRSLFTPGGPVARSWLWRGNQGLWRFGRGQLEPRQYLADFRHRLSRILERTGGRRRLQPGRSALYRRHRRRSAILHLLAGASASGQRVRRQARLADRRLLFERDSEHRFGTEVRQPVRPVFGLPRRFLDQRIVHLGFGAGLSDGDRAWCAGRQYRAHGARARFAEPGRGCRGRRDALSPKERQPGRLHAQYLPHHRYARSDARPALHARGQGTGRDARQLQHLLPTDPRAGRQCFGHHDPRLPRQFVVGDQRLWPVRPDRGG